MNITDETVERAARAGMEAIGSGPFPHGAIHSDYLNFARAALEAALAEEDHEGHEFCDPRLGCVLPEEWEYLTVSHFGEDTKFRRPKWAAPDGAWEPVPESEEGLT